MTLADPSPFAARPRRIHVVDGDPLTAASLERALQGRGHDCLAFSSGRESLRAEPPDCLVADADLADLGGWELVRAWRARGRRPEVILLASRPGVEEYREALRLGALDLLARPFSLDELVAAVEAEDPPGPDSADRTSEREPLFRGTYRASAEGARAALGDLLAHLVRRGIRPSARARIASAASEMVDNVLAHAYPGGEGPLHVAASHAGERVEVRVRDAGVGCDAVEARLGSVACIDGRPALDGGGIARAATLAEDLSLGSSERGTEATLGFDLSTATFDEGGAIDLTELDFLDPATAELVLASLEKSETSSLFHLPPSLAPSIGRLLAGRSRTEHAQSALWS